MSDLDKIDKLEKAIKFVKENSVVVGFVLAAVPIIGGAFYTGITELNKAKDALSQFTEMTEGYSELKSKVKALETANENLKERLNNVAEGVIKVQDRTSEALLAGRQGQTIAESTQKETRAQIVSIKAEVQSALDAVKIEMNAIRKATTNRLGN